MDDEELESASIETPAIRDNEDDSDELVSESSGSIRAKWTSKVAEALQSTYTSQYITGVAYVVTTFIRWKTTSQYHRNAVFCLVAINSTVGLIVNFDRPFILGFRVQVGKNGRRGFRWKTLHMVDFGLLLTLLVFIAFGISTLVAQDEHFMECFKGWRIFISCSLIGFGLMCFFVMKRTKGPRSTLAWLTFIIAVGLFLAAQSLYFKRLTQKFRSQDSNGSDETVISFGQILVLFMIVPIVADFTAGMIGK